MAFNFYCDILRKPGDINGAHNTVVFKIDLAEDFPQLDLC